MRVAMSIKLMSDVWDAPVFKGNAKLIMLCLADFANDEGVCWPSVATIARKCTVSVSTVKTQIRQLMTAEFVTVKNRLKTTEEGKITNDTNYYQINVHHLQQVVLMEGEIQPGQKVIRGQAKAQPGAKSGYKPPVDPLVKHNNPKVPCDVNHGPDPSGSPPVVTLAQTQATTRRRNQTELPDSFMVSEAMRTWYKSQEGFVLSLESATATWSDAMRAKGYKNRDWVAAWRNGMRRQNMWAKSKPSTAGQATFGVNRLPGEQADYSLPEELQKYDDVSNR